MRRRKVTSPSPVRSSPTVLPAIPIGGSISIFRCWRRLRTLAGHYTLTFIADSACAAFPNTVRTYAATLTPMANPYHPVNTLYNGTVSGAAFLEGYNGFLVGVAGDYIAGWFGDLHGDPGLVEQVAPTTYFALGGGVAGSVTSGSTISASFDGFLDSCELQSAMGARYSCTPGPAAIRAQCNSRNHRLTLTRR